MANINIYGTLKNQTPEGVLAIAEQIMDEDLSKKQSQINQETNQAIEQINSKIETGLVFADEEDIHKNEEDKLSFADRTYNAEQFSGKGYKILRKNIQDGKNILTQDMLNEANTVYEIRYDFDLNEAKITIPEDCVLQFNGGSLSNGFINGKICNEYVIPEWFGAKGDGIVDDGYAIVNSFNVCKKVILGNSKNYLIDNSKFDQKINISNTDFSIIGNKSTITIGKNIAIKNSSLNSHTAHIIIKLTDVSFYAENFTFVTLAENLYTETTDEENYLDGDFSLIYVSGNTTININSVNSYCDKKRNNLTFLFISSSSPYVSLLNSTVYHDTDSARGGAVWYMTSGNYNRNLTIDNCTFYNNAADEDVVLTVKKEGIDDNILSINTINITNSKFFTKEYFRDSVAFIIYNAPKDKNNITCNTLIDNCVFNSVSNKNLIFRPASESKQNIEIKNSTIKTNGSIMNFKCIYEPIYINNCLIDIIDNGQIYPGIVPDSFGNVIYNINYINCNINCPYLYEEYNRSNGKILFFKNCNINTKARNIRDKAKVLLSICTSLDSCNIIAPDFDIYTYEEGFYYELTYKGIPYNSFIKNTNINGVYINNTGIMTTTTKDDIFCSLYCKSNFKELSELLTDFNNFIKNSSINVRVYDKNSFITSCKILIQNKEKIIERSSEENLFFQGIKSEFKNGLNVIRIVVNEKTILTKHIYYNIITDENYYIDNDNIILTGSSKGTFSQKPNVLDGISIGFAYYCTDITTADGNTGLMIYHKGNDIWMDGDGNIITDNSQQTNWQIIE